MVGMPERGRSTAPPDCCLPFTARRMLAWCQEFAMKILLLARLKGHGSKRPLLILAHTDVVPVQREKWPVDPFGAILKDGYVWGRGSTDDKPVLTAVLMTMLLLKRTGVALDRDVIFLAESG